MPPGPSKQFDPAEALESARDLFWRRGYDGTSISDLETTLGIGRKSLYDTFGSKRELYLRSIENYADSVIGRICARLDHQEGAPIRNIARALDKLREHHASNDSLGCLLGVAMGQAARDDEELAELLRASLRRLEDAFDSALRRAQKAGEIRSDIRPRDAARNLVALTQGMALIGRVSDTPAQQRSIVRAALHSLQN